MNKELQDLAWSCLPREVKEEVKFEYYRVATKAQKDEYDLGFMHAHEGMFGIHNLTSDAEGEEMLYCEKSKVRTMYDNAADMIVGNQLDSEAAQMAMLTKGLFEELFGTKCLPDEEPKPAEPEEKLSDSTPLNRTKGSYGSDQPVTDRHDFDKTSPRPKQDHFGENSEMVDNIIKDSFRNHNRLHIAALAMQGLLFDGMRDPDTVAEVAFEYADALIRKSKKGGDDGKD